MRERPTDTPDAPLDASAYGFVHHIRVRFAETDAMGVVHHASYLPYLEETRVAFLRELGHPYASIRADGTDFAVISVGVRYIAPLRFDDQVAVHLRVAAASGARFRLGYLLTCGEAAAATAVTEHAALDRSGRPQRLPAWLRAMAATPR